MYISASQGQTIVDSYDLIRAHEVNYSQIFYDRLLHDHPFARALFPDDMTHQVNVFREMIDALVSQIDDLSALQPSLTDLAKRHVAYGVKAWHYEVVGEGLIGCFSDVLADRFTTAMREAWEALYSATAGAMIAEAYPKEQSS
ncbi:globin domain-containing protein [Sphingomonas oligophenolica]|uniref:Hemin receptor n=1 Tax=Sphingomonas oligophenolica TaxID=301154 RepID=A0A502C1F0_9SPHN|nr:globin domain-containing protein [Sphingomonas oligophenolica]TPG06572.1 hemin receptor [Sphingomonas oligophenolica]